MDVDVALRVPLERSISVVTRMRDTAFTRVLETMPIGYASQDRELVRQPGSSSRSGQRRGVSGWRGWNYLVPQHSNPNHTRAIAATSGPCLLKSSAGRCSVHRRNDMFCNHTTSMIRSLQSCQTWACRLVRGRGRQESSISHISQARGAADLLIGSDHQGG